jgi:hypothetical protein
MTADFGQILKANQMGLMITSKPVIIIIWACQEMMAWMSMEIIVSMDVIL